MAWLTPAATSAGVSCCCRATEKRSWRAGPRRGLTVTSTDVMSGPGPRVPDTADSRS